MPWSIVRISTAAALSAAVGLVTVSSCVRPPPYDPSEEAASRVDVSDDVNVVWDGDDHGGKAKEWANCNLKAACESSLEVNPGVGLNDSIGLEWQVKGKDWKGFGWNWHGFWPENAGTDITEYNNLSFWIRLKADDSGKAPDLKDLKVGLAGSTKGKDETETVPLISYIDSLSDGQWHEVIVPIGDLTKGKGKDFDLTRAWEFRMGEYSMADRDFSIFIDNIGFDNRAVIALISLPEKRDPAPLGSDVLDITAKIDNKAPGTPVSPYIYGVSHGDAETMHEMGVTIRRQGGNLSSVYDWRTGNASAGHDWFFENRKELETPHPQENWWVVMQRENEQFGMKSFFTLPSEWVAKDDSSSGFPKEKYPDCEQFAPDRPDACNGKSSKEKDAEGKPKEFRCGEIPTQNGKQVGLQYNVDLLKYCINEAGLGTAAQGGIDIIALDNEPMLYRETHRDMWCHGFTADEFWDRTQKAAEALKKVDPSVKIAGPALWGWTAYSLSSGDQEYREVHGLGWDKTAELPDFKKYGPFALDYMRRAAAYKKQHDKDLIDIFVFHGYPMTPKLGWDNRAEFANPSAELQEFRVRDVRKFWDESYRDPETWMGKEEWANGNVAYIPLMRRWMKEAGWNAPLAIGEYDHAGPEGGEEISAAVAQAESFGAFARTQLSYAMYWAGPRKHSPVYFAFKMFRNPDGKHTTVGDNFILGEVSDYDSVSVYAFKDEKRKLTSLILLNKRAKKGARVTLQLSAPVPAQKAKRYEFSHVNEKAIGELPPLDISGKKIAVSIAPMSILRLDIKN